MKSVAVVVIATSMLLVSPVSVAMAKEMRLAGATSGAEDSGEIASTDYASIFAQTPDLIDSGWSLCESPIRWSVDTGGLNAAQSKREVANLRWALSLWSRASGLNFAFAGTTALTFDEDAFSLTPVDGPTSQDRQMFFDFIPAKGAAVLGGETVAAGSPSSVVMDSKEIVAGTGVFETEHIKKVTSRQARSLYLHEIGHLLGLAHAQSARNVMYPIVTEQIRLGPGDVNGVKAMTKPCRSTPA
ncbi:MAG: matrixin family metalloprotease [Candidatus Nanopelagicales bacterium]